MALIEACDSNDNQGGIVFIKDVLKDVVQSTSDYLTEAMSSVFNKPIVFVHGVSEYVVEYFRLNPTNTPAIVFIQPYDEIVGGDYLNVNLLRSLVVTNYDEKDNLTVRDEQTIKPILVPMYVAFLQNLVQHNSIVTADWNKLKHTRTIVPGWQPAANSLDLYLDAIELKNLQIQIYNY